MNKRDLEAVLNGLFYSERVEVGGETYMLTARVNFVQEGQSSLFEALSGSRKHADRSCGKLDPEVAVWQDTPRGWVSPNIGMTPPAVVHRFADLLGHIQAWTRNEAPWPRPASSFDA